METYWKICLLAFTMVCSARFAFENDNTCNVISWIVCTHVLSCLLRRCCGGICGIFDGRAWRQAVSKGAEPHPATDQHDNKKTLIYIFSVAQAPLPGSAKTIKHQVVC